MRLLVVEDSPLLGKLMEQAKTLGVAAIVKKPWSPQALRSVVQKVLESAKE